MYHSKQSKQPKVKPQHPVLYLIGDNYSDTQVAREVLLMANKNEFKLIDNEGERDFLHVYYSNVLGNDKPIEVYDFPTARHVRHCLDIYFQMLPKPDLIIYVTDIQSQRKELQQWVQLIEHEDPPMVFISNSHNVDEKHLLIKKISYFFQNPIDEYVYMPNVDKQSIYECLENIWKEGVSLKSYIRRVNSWSRVKSVVSSLAYFFKTKSFANTSSNIV